MTTRIIFIIAAYALFALSLLYGPLNAMVTKKKTGEKVMDVAKPPVYLLIVVYAICFGVISVMWIRDFGDTMNFVMCGCGVLASFLTSRSLFFRNLYGIYKEGIIYDGLFVKYSDIMAFPVLALPKEEQVNYESKTFVLQSSKKGKIAFTFASEEEYKLVVEKIFELKPEFKKFI